MEENTAGKTLVRTKDNCISWKSILKYICEFSDDDWFTVKEFSELYGIKKVRLQQQFATFQSWGYIRRKKKKREEGKRFYKEFLYQPTPAARNRLEYIIKQAERDALFFCAQQKTSAQ